MGALQPIHWIIVLVVVLILFGPGKLPMLGQSLGQTLRDFRKTMQDPDAKTPLEAPEEHCTNCGDVLVPEAKFCARCGAARPASAVGSKQ